MRENAHPRVALVTYAGLPHLSVGDQLLAAALEASGAAAEAARWDDAEVPWTSFDAVVVRSTWDYHLRSAEFLGWIDRLERAQVALWNPPRVLRWNAEKSYLGALTRAGVPTVPTTFVDAADERTLTFILEAAGWQHAVVKPAISASAHETWTTSLRTSSADEPRFRAQQTRGRLLVQPFIRELAEHGEWSLMFIAGAYSHAVLKRAADGDFRVQEQYGGVSELREAPSSLVEGARAVLEVSLSLAGATSSGALYARVDGCAVNGTFLVAEVEMVEPSLFVELHPVAASWLARAILQRIEVPRAFRG